MTDIAMSMAQEQIKELRAEVERHRNDYSVLKRDYDELRADNERLREQLNNCRLPQQSERELRVEIERLKAVVKAHESDNELRYFGEIPL